MAIQLAAALTGFSRLAAGMFVLRPDNEDSGAMKGLRKLAFRIQEVASTEMIIRGRGKGAPPLPNRLTGRTGALAGSIAVDDRLPDEIAIGTALVYGAVHEGGLSVRGRGGSTIHFPSRPFLAPAVEAVAPNAANIVVQSWSGGL